MSRKTKDQGRSPFARLLGWTVLLALVFSAGLITGERLVRKESLESLATLSHRTVPPPTTDDAAPDAPAEAKDEPKPLTLSFFDGLSGAPAPAATDAAKPAGAAPAQKAGPKPQPKPAAEAGAPAPDAADDAGRYTLQVAAHPDMASAKAHMTRLSKMGLEPHVVAAEIPGKGEFFRVRIGRFVKMDQAREFQQELQRKNALNTFVTPL